MGAHCKIPRDIDYQGVMDNDRRHQGVAVDFEQWWRVVSSSMNKNKLNFKKEGTMGNANFLKQLCHAIEVWPQCSGFCCCCKLWINLWVSEHLTCAFGHMTDLNDNMRCGKCKELERHLSCLNMVTVLIGKHCFFVTLRVKMWALHCGGSTFF